jgi:amidase
MNDLHRWSAVALAEAIRTQTVSSVEAVTACFEQIERQEPQLNAFITLCREQAFQAAKAADAQIKQGEPVGILHGIPIAIKDVTATAGIRTTYGSQRYQTYIPAEDELCVARLKQAGAIILGKTSVPEFGFGNGTTNPVSGTTVNPYDLSRSPGGSSGGSAVAVAAGMCHLAQGTDLGGSVRTPASFCGIVGLRPAIGRIPRLPKPLLWESLITDGVLARSVEDAALMLAAMAGFDPRDPIAIASDWQVPQFEQKQSSWEQIKIGCSVDLGIATIDPAVKQAFEQAIDIIAKVCPNLEIAHPDCTKAQFAFETLRAGLIHHLYGHLLEQKAEAVNEILRWEIEQGVGLTAAAYIEAESQRGQLYQQFMDFFQRYDVLITVSASIPPFPADQVNILEINNTPLRNQIDYLTITYTISLTGLPSLSLPAVWVSGLPIGIQLVGKPHAEAQLLQFAYFLQEQCNFRHRWPE